MARTVLITGAARRIGRCLAENLAREGYSVVVHCNQSIAEAEVVVQALRDTGARAAALTADLTRIDALNTLLGRAEEAIDGPIDILINNASVFEDDQLGNLTSELWDRHMAIHVKAPVFLTQAFAERVNARNAEGVVVNIIDQRVWKLTPQFFSYTLSKSALLTATKTMAQALAPSIRVNAIGPGPTFCNQRQSAEDFEKQAENVLLQRSSDPLDIARAARFLIETPSVTGQMIAVDSGQHLSWETADVIGISE